MQQYEVYQTIINPNTGQYEDKVVGRFNNYESALTKRNRVQQFDFDTVECWIEDENGYR